MFYKSPDAAIQGYYSSLGLALILFALSATGAMWVRSNWSLVGRGKTRIGDPILHVLPNKQVWVIHYDDHTGEKVSVPPPGGPEVVLSVESFRWRIGPEGTPTEIDARNE